MSTNHFSLRLLSPELHGSFIHVRERLRHLRIREHRRHPRSRVSNHRTPSATRTSPRISYIKFGYICTIVVYKIQTSFGTNPHHHLHCDDHPTRLLGSGSFSLWRSALILRDVRNFSLRGQAVLQGYLFTHQAIVSQISTAHYWGGKLTAVRPSLVTTLKICFN